MSSSFLPRKGRHYADFQRAFISILEEVATLADADLLGAIHLKECKDVPEISNDPEFDEKKLGSYHCPAGTGDAGIEAVFAALAARSAGGISDKLRRFKFDGLPCMIEGHLLAGGHYMGC